ncbi:hypothetical protein [Niabella aquatica]
MKKNILILLFVIAFIGCDPGSEYRQTIQNNSSADIWIVAYEKINNTHSPNDSVFVKSNTKAVFFTGSGGATGGYWTNKDCAYPLNIDSLGAKILKEPPSKLAFDINDKSRWIYSESGNRSKGVKMQCTITITDADIVSK